MTIQQSLFALFLASAVLMPAAHAQVAFPNKLTVVINQADVSISGLSGVLATATDPVLATTSLGASFGEVNHQAGTLRGRAEIADSIGDFRQTTATYLVQLRNDSGLPLSFSAGGAPRLEVSAAFARTFGLGAGVSSTTVNAALVMAVVDDLGNPVFSGAGSFFYSVSQELAGQPPVVSYFPQASAGFSVLNESFGLLSANADIVSPALQLAPGHTLALTATISGSALAFGFTGNTGFAAAADFANTAQLLMDLPPGWEVQSALPLGWVGVSPIPEPSTVVLWLAGAALLAGARRFRQS